MAGLGRRTFAAGEVLTAGNVMGYLQDQAVMKFAGTAARGSAIGTAVAEGMVSYLADTNAVEVYDGSLWKQVYPAVDVPTTGQILQVVSTTKTDAFSTASTTYVDITGLSVSITPKSSTNKVLVTVNTTLSVSGGAATQAFQLRRAGNNIAASTGAGFNGTFLTNYASVAANDAMIPVAFSFLDSPATTAATTYNVQTLTSSGTLYINRRALDTYMGAISTITVMEVVA